MPLTHLECARCQRHYPAGEVHTLCECGGPLLARYDLDKAAKNMRPGHLALREPTLWRYDDVLPVDNPDYRISLGEGFTPLLTARRLGSAIGIPRLSIKDESQLPGGSFKARGLALAVNGAVAWGDQLVKTGRLSSIATMNNIAGQPVIDRGRVFAASHSGRMVSLDLRTGERVWERDLASLQSPWVAGDFVYMVTVEAEVVCLSRNDGRIRWVQPLPRFPERPVGLR